MEHAQLFKGILEGCILKIISTEETYGYEIIVKLQEYGFEDIKEGTAYPLLLRLEKKSYITARFKNSPLGPKRKYYTLTENGQEQLELFYTQWQKICVSVNRIFKGGSDDEYMAQ